jgi:hypothetical protein
MNRTSFLSTPFIINRFKAGDRYVAGVNPPAAPAVFTAEKNDFIFFTLPKAGAITATVGGLPPTAPAVHFTAENAEGAEVKL